MAAMAPAVAEAMSLTRPVRMPMAVAAARLPPVAKTPVAKPMMVQEQVEKTNSSPRNQKEGRVQPKSDPAKRLVKIGSGSKRTCTAPL